jgi:hypothetical protein
MMGGNNYIECQPEEHRVYEPPPPRKRQCRST